MLPLHDYSLLLQLQLRLVSLGSPPILEQAQIGCQRPIYALLTKVPVHLDPPAKVRSS